MKLFKFTSFYVRSSLYIALTIAAAIANYFVYPLLTRIISVEDFGEFATVISLSSQILAVLTSFTIISIFLVKNYSDKFVNDATEGIQKILIRLIVIFAIILSFSAAYFMNLLKLQNPMSLIAVLAILLCSIPLTNWTGYLQGKKKVVEVGTASLIGSLTKLIAVVMLASAFGLTGSLYALILASFLTLIPFAYIGKFKLPGPLTPFQKLPHAQSESLKKIKSYLIPAILSVTLLGILQNFDVILSKYIFSNQVAGQYSSVGLFSNIIFYLGFFLTLVILPEIEISNIRHNRKIVLKASGLITLMVVSSLLLNILFGDRGLDFVFGQKYSNLQDTLSYSIIYQGSLSLITLLVYVYLILGKKTKAVIVSSLLFVLCISQPLFDPSSPTILLRRMSYSALSVVGLAGMLYISERRSKKVYENN